jgi:uncharacterized protein YndB with AHSA1/START domain
MIVLVAVLLLTMLLASTSIGAQGAPAAVTDAANPSEGWALTAAQLERLEAGAILSDGKVTSETPVAEFRAVVQIGVPPQQVFRTLTDCAQALRFVPHLKRCAVIDTAADGRWQDVEQTVDYGWLAPRSRYVFHAEYEPYERIRFSHVRGDFHENEGAWEFRPVQGGRATLVFYRARVSPAFYVPRWLMRSMLKRDLPDLMRGLRARAEAGPPPAVTGSPIAVPPG